MPIRTQEKSPIRIRKKGPGSETLHLGEGKGVRALQDFVKCFRCEPNTVMIRALILKNKMCICWRVTTLFIFSDSEEHFSIKLNNSTITIHKTLLCILSIFLLLFSINQSYFFFFYLKNYFSSYDNIGILFCSLFMFVCENFNFYFGEAISLIFF